MPVPASITHAFPMNELLHYEVCPWTTLAYIPKDIKADWTEIFIQNLHNFLHNQLAQTRLVAPRHQDDHGTRAVSLDVWATFDGVEGVAKVDFQRYLVPHEVIGEVAGSKYGSLNARTLTANANMERLQIGDTTPCSLMDALAMTARRYSPTTRGRIPSSFLLRGTREKGWRSGGRYSQEQCWKRTESTAVVT